MRRSSPCPRRPIWRCSKCATGSSMPVAAFYPRWSGARATILCTSPYRDVAKRLAPTVRDQVRWAQTWLGRIPHTEVLLPKWCVIFWSIIIPLKLLNCLTPGRWRYRGGGWRRWDSRGHRQCADQLWTVCAGPQRTNGQDGAGVRGQCHLQVTGNRSLWPASLALVTSISYPIPPTSKLLFLFQAGSRPLQTTRWAFKVFTPRFKQPWSIKLKTIRCARLPPLGVRRLALVVLVGRAPTPVLPHQYCHTAFLASCRQSSMTKKSQDLRSA